jgi:hypothetical protein
MAQWCRENRDTGFIPAFVTGHNTIYAWRCQKSAPRIVRQTLHADPRGSSRNTGSRCRSRA